MLHPALSKTAVCELSWDLRRTSWAEFVPLLLRSATSMTAFFMSSTLPPLYQVCSDENIFLYFHSFPIFLPVTANFGPGKKRNSDDDWQFTLSAILRSFHSLSPSSFETWLLYAMQALNRFPILAQTFIPGICTRKRQFERKTGNKKEKLMQIKKLLCW